MENIERVESEFPSDGLDSVLGEIEVPLVNNITSSGQPTNDPVENSSNNQPNDPGNETIAIDASTSAQDCTFVAPMIVCKEEAFGDLTDELKKRILKAPVDRDEVAPLPFSVILALSTMLAMRIEHIAKTHVSRMPNEVKKEILMLSSNQLMVCNLVNDIGNELISSSVMERPRTTIEVVGGQSGVTETVHQATAVANQLPVNNIIRENLYLKKEISKLESRIPFEPSRRDRKNEDGAWGRSYSFRSNVECCAGTVFVKNLNQAEKADIMKFTQSIKGVYASWRPNLIVMDSICTCKGASSECPIKIAVEKIKDKAPTTNPRVTIRFLPRIKVKIQGLVEDANVAWEQVKEAFPSNSEMLGGTPKVITSWRDRNRVESAFIFEVAPSIRHLVAGKNVRSRTANVHIRDSIYIPVCKKCRKIGHLATKCTSTEQVPRTDFCVSCVNADHHPLSLDCGLRDRLIRAKLARIDYGPQFRNKIVLYQ